MNEVSLIIEYIINKFKEDSLVNTITMQSDYEFDAEKENIYCIVNLRLKEVDQQPDYIEAFFEITVAQKREEAPDVLDSKLQLDSNMIDNLNETFAVGNKFLQTFKLYNSFRIELGSQSRFKPFLKRPPKSLDGYKFDVSLTIPNKVSGC